ncbi:hypothetical protein AgCh_017850 [Apium graveolens]
MQRNITAAFDNSMIYSYMVAGSSGKVWKLLALVVYAEQRFSEAETIADLAFDETEKIDQLELLRLKAPLQIAQEQPKQTIETYRIILSLIRAQGEHQRKDLDSQGPLVRLRDIPRTFGIIFRDRQYRKIPTNLNAFVYFVFKAAEINPRFFTLKVQAQKSIGREKIKSCTGCGQDMCLQKGLGSSGKETTRDEKDDSDGEEDTWMTMDTSSESGMSANDPREEEEFD